MFQVLHLDVLKVNLVLHMLLWLYTYVSSTCFKYFICFQIYVASVSIGCYKSRSRGSTCARLLVVVLLLRACRLGVVSLHVWARTSSRAGWVRARKLGVSGAGAGAPSDVSDPDWTSGH
jgi:hypothetical protein